MSDKPNGTMSEQDVAYMVQVLTTRPLGEALPLWLKLTGQQVVPIAASASPDSPSRAGGPVG
jgi:hypothetical protein